MLILLPPSETKREGGDPDARLELGALAYGQLTPQRELLVEATVSLAADVEASLAALKLSARGVAEVERNRVIRTAPVMPAVDRYDGVLYDALDGATLSEEARAFAHEHVLIASALFGVTRALDPIPAYRLSADSRLPGVRLKQHWAPALGEALAMHDGLILDMRSEAYAALGPLPTRADAVFVRVVSEEGGRKRALNHFNKAGKGRLTRALVASGIVHEDVDGLLAWADAEGIRLERGAAGELDLVV
ncbi:MULTISPECIES: peroxide stress protein YaaA [unclassified Salinibacterium]|uniref:YaaA family protein n=1 Tax=unclassified Salinibacterium TaxID=2632331 RepID=UPI0014201BDA|nr:MULTISPECIES: peroxide stress protein YaaA [unclassified Salinibacterium]